MLLKEYSVWTFNFKHAPNRRYHHAPDSTIWKSGLELGSEFSSGKRNSFGLDARLVHSQLGAGWKAGNTRRRGLRPGVKCTRNMDLKAKKETLRLLTNGVYVLTARNGDDYGVATITWVSQVSFQPPLVMAALRKDGNVFRCLRASGVAVLHVVGSDQKELAQKFFSTTKEANGLLNGEPFAEGKTSAPVLKDLSAYLECKLVDICEDYGDHAIVILEVVEAGNSGATEPLIVSNSPWKYGG